MKLAASTIATIMLRFSGVSVFQDGNIIDLGITQLQVVEACSGLRYLMPLFLLALLIGYFFTKGWWRNGIIVLLVVPLSVFFNALRIWMSGILTVKGHPELVENFFHDFSGWVIFMIAGAILFGVTRIINRIGRYDGDKQIIDTGESRSFGLARPVVTDRHRLPVVCVQRLRASKDPFGHQSSTEAVLSILSGQYRPVGRPPQLHSPGNPRSTLGRRLRAGLVCQSAHTQCDPPADPFLRVAGNPTHHPRPPVLPSGRRMGLDRISGKDGGR